MVSVTLPEPEADLKMAIKWRKYCITTTSYVQEKNNVKKICGDTHVLAGDGEKAENNNEIAKLITPCILNKRINKQTNT